MQSDKAPSFARAISVTSALLVIFLAVAAFALSFHALQALANEHGFDRGLSWLWPCVLDGSIIVFSLSALRSSLYRENVRYEMTLVILATLASVGFNIAHAQPDALARLMAVVPPVCLFMSFEVLMRQIRSEVERNATTSNAAILSEEVAALENAKSELVGQINKLRAVAQDNSGDNSPSVRQILEKANEGKRAKVSQRREKVSRLKSKGLSVSDIAEQLKVSAKTIQRDLAALDSEAFAA